MASLSRQLAQWARPKRGENELSEEEESNDEETADGGSEGAR